MHNIREMKVSDYPGLISLAMSNYGGNYVRRLENGHWQSQQSKDETAWFVVEDLSNTPYISNTSSNISALKPSSLLGAIGVSQVGETAKLHGLMIHPKKQSNGIGRDLFEYALNFAQTLPVNMILAYSRATDIRAQYLPEHHGFTVAGFLPNRIPALSEDPNHKSSDLESLVMYIKFRDVLSTAETRDFYSRNCLKVDDHMKKIRVTHADPVPLGLLSGDVIQELLKSSKNYFVEIDVLENTDSHDMMKSFFYDPRIFAPVALRPSPALGNNLIRYASWMGDFPREDSLRLTPAATFMYELVKNSYEHEKLEHNREALIRLKTLLKENSFRPGEKTFSAHFLSEH